MLKLNQKVKKLVNIVDLRKDDSTLQIRGLCDACTKDCKASEGFMCQCPDFSKNSEVEEAVVTFAFEDAESPEIIEFVDNVEIKNGYEVDIQESAQLGEPFIAVTNGQKRLYFRKGEKQGEYTHLILLTKSELKSLHIEETANDDLKKELGIEEVV
jgi:hypothetical protein